MSLRTHYEVSFYRKEAHGSTSKDTEPHRAHIWFLTQPPINSKSVHLVSATTQGTNLGSLSITSQASEGELPILNTDILYSDALEVLEQNTDIQTMRCILECTVGTLILSAAPGQKIENC